MGVLKKNASSKFGLGLVHGLVHGKNKGSPEATLKAVPRSWF